MTASIDRNQRNPRELEITKQYELFTAANERPESLVYCLRCSAQIDSDFFDTCGVCQSAIEKPKSENNMNTQSNQKPELLEEIPRRIPANHLQVGNSWNYYPNTSEVPNDWKAVVKLLLEVPGITKGQFEYAVSRIKD